MKTKTTLKLDPPRTTGTYSVEEALSKRRSNRKYIDSPLKRSSISQMLWATQGKNSKKGRTTPSAGASYPLEIYIIIGDVEDIPSGTYHYDVEAHTLAAIGSGDKRTQLKKACLGQNMCNQAPASIIIAADYSRTTDIYGERGVRYVDMEAGHAGQNIYMQAQSLGMVTVAVGAFNDPQIKELFKMPETIEPLYIYSLGRFQ